MLLFEIMHHRHVEYLMNLIMMMLICDYCRSLMMGKRLKKLSVGIQMMT